MPTKLKTWRVKASSRLGAAGGQRARSSPAPVSSGFVAFVLTIAIPVSLHRTWFLWAVWVTIGAWACPPSQPLSLFSTAFRRAGAKRQRPRPGLAAVRQRLLRGRGSNSRWARRAMPATTLSPSRSSPRSARTCFAAAPSARGTDGRVRVHRDLLRMKVKFACACLRRLRESGWCG
jgi:hypothetical protein